MNQMNDATKRSILRWIHFVFGIPIIGYVYGPFEELSNYAPVVWKGKVIRRLVSKRSA
jgi:hypothetical protein